MEGKETIKVVVLCAGQASRLYPFSDLLPKSMIPVGGRPVLRWIMDRLITDGFKDIVLCVNEKDHPLFLDYFGHGEWLKVNIAYSTSGTPHGTVGEVLHAEETDQDLFDADFLLHYGDELTEINFRIMQRIHARKKGAATLALVRNVPLDFGVVSLARGLNRIVQFEEKPRYPKYVWAGVAMLKPEPFLKHARMGDDFGQNLFPRMLKEGEKLYPAKVPSEWMDVGTLSHYRRACRLATEGKL